MTIAHKLETANPSPNSDHHLDRILNHLRQVKLFHELWQDEPALKALAGIMHEKTFDIGHAIVTEGHEGTEMFVLIEGQVSVYKSTPGGDEYKVAILDGSKFIAFGESGLIEAEQRTATIRTDTFCRCLILDRKTFEKFSTDHSHWALPIYRRIAHGVMARLRKTNNDMLLLYNALVAEIRGQ